MRRYLAAALTCVGALVLAGTFVEEGQGSGFFSRILSRNRCAAPVRYSEQFTAISKVTRPAVNGSYSKNVPFNAYGMNDDANDVIYGVVINEANPDDPLIDDSDDIGTNEYNWSLDFTLQYLGATVFCVESLANGLFSQELVPFDVNNDPAPPPAFSPRPCVAAARPVRFPPPIVSIRTITPANPAPNQPFTVRGVYRLFQKDQVFGVLIDRVNRRVYPGHVEAHGASWRITFAGRSAGQYVVRVRGIELDGIGDQADVTVGP